MNRMNNYSKQARPLWMFIYKTNLKHCDSILPSEILNVVAAISCWFLLVFFNNWNTPLCALCQACHLFSSSGSGLHNFFFVCFIYLVIIFVCTLLCTLLPMGTLQQNCRRFSVNHYLVAIVVRADWNHVKDFTILTFFLPYYDQAVEMVKVKLFHV